MLRTPPRFSKRTRPAPDQRRGVVALFLLASLVVIVGVGALALNLTWLTSHQVQLRHASEAAALAGAEQLLDPAPNAPASVADPAAEARIVLAKEQARIFFGANSPAFLITTGPTSDVVPGWCENPLAPHAAFAPWNSTGPVNSLTIRGVRRHTYHQAVSLWFGSFFGVSRAEPAAAARATIDQRIYGFRPLEYVAVPMVPLLTPANLAWPSGAPASAGALPDNYTINPRTRVVTPGSDGIGEITLQVPLAGGAVPSGQASSWMWLLGGTTNFPWLAAQVRIGLEPIDLTAVGGQIALGTDGTVVYPAAPTPDVTQADLLITALLTTRGQKRIWPVGQIDTVAGQPAYRVTGFVGGCVVDCSRNSNSLNIVVQGSTIQTCTGLLRTGTARNAWIGKLILNE
jgi:hypothetical protein